MPTRTDKEPTITAEAAPVATDKAAPVTMDKAPTVIVETCPPRNCRPVVEVPLREGMTLDELIETLQLPNDTEAVIVNNAIVRPSYRLQDGDRVKVIPFMSGG